MVVWAAPNTDDSAAMFKFTLYMMAYMMVRKGFDMDAWCVYYKTPKRALATWQWILDGPGHPQSGKIATQITRRIALVTRSKRAKIVGIVANSRGEKGRLGVRRIDGALVRDASGKSMEWFDSPGSQVKDPSINPLVYQKMDELRGAAEAFVARG